MWHIVESCSENSFSALSRFPTFPTWTSYWHSPSPQTCVLPQYTWNIHGCGSSGALASWAQRILTSPKMRGFILIQNLKQKKKKDFMEICWDQLKVLQSAPFPHMRLPSFTFSSPDLCTNLHHPLLLLGMAPNSWLPVGWSQATLHTHFLVLPRMLF